MEWLPLIIGFVVGLVAAGVFMARLRTRDQEEIERLEDRLDDMKAQRDDFREKASEGKKTIKSLRSAADERDQLRQERDELDAQHEAELDELRETVARRERQIDDLRQEVHEREESISSLRKRVAAVEGEEAALEGGLDEQEQIVADLRKRLEERDEVASKAESKIEEAQGKVASLEDDLKGSRDTNRRLNARVTELKASVNKLTERFAARNQRINELESELESARRESSLVAPAPEPGPESMPQEEVEKLANERLVMAYKRDVGVKDEEIADLRKQISQRDRKITELLNEARAADEAEPDGGADRASEAVAAAEAPGEEVAPDGMDEADAGYGAPPSGQASPKAETEPADPAAVAAQEADDRSQEQVQAVDEEVPVVTAAADLTGDRQDAPVETRGDAPEALRVEGEDAPVADRESDPDSTAATAEEKAAQLAQQGEPMDREVTEARDDDVLLPDASTSEAIEDASEAASTEAAAESVTATPDDEPADGGPSADLTDDLTSIKGIGKVLAGRLNAAGIRSFEALAAQSPESLEEIVQPQSWQAYEFERWIEEAGERNGG